jgi:hypothetical protein
MHLIAAACQLRDVRRDVHARSVESGTAARYQGSPTDKKPQPWQGP